MYMMTPKSMQKCCLYLSQTARATLVEEQEIEKCENGINMDIDTDNNLQLDPSSGSRPSRSHPGKY